jgi:metal-responsive CopG/Arc/MetJ family transcriptional regulator
MLLKQNLSLSLSSSLVEQIDNLKEKYNLSRSEIVEMFLKDSLEKKLLDDAKILSTMSFEDLPNEDDWNILQNN